jgi:hypothetical protein
MKNNHFPRPADMPLNFWQLVLDPQLIFPATENVLPNWSISLFLVYSISIIGGDLLGREAANLI